MIGLFIYQAFLLDYGGSSKNLIDGGYTTLFSGDYCDVL